MTESPFSMSIPMMFLSFFAMLMGAVVGSIFFKIGFGGLIAGALCGFLPQPVNSVLRVLFGSAMAKAADYKGRAPYAFSMPVRYGIALAVSFAVAYVLLLVTGMPVNAVSGLLISIVTTLFVALIMAAKITMSQ